MQKSLKVFEAKGATKLIKEAKHKLHMLSNSMKAAGNGLDFDESESDGAEDDKPKKKVKKRKIVKKKAQKNNFFD